MGGLGNKGVVASKPYFADAHLTRQNSFENNDRKAEDGLATINNHLQPTSYGNRCYI